MFTIWFMTVVAVALITIPALISLQVGLQEQVVHDQQVAVILLWGQRFGHIGWEDWSRVRGRMRRGR